jgi:hypothetical protein
MTERSKHPVSEADRLTQEFKTHLASVEFGSPDYLAFYDFFALEDQRQTCTRQVEHIRKNPSLQNDPSITSKLRITETKIALLENEIERRKMTDITYEKAFSYVDERMAELRKAIWKEDDPSSEDHTTWRLSLEYDTYHDTLVNDFMDVLYRFFDKSS